MTMLLNRTLCLCLLINLDKSHDETVGTKWNGIDLPEGFRSHDGPVQYALILSGNQNIAEKLNYGVKMV